MGYPQCTRVRDGKRCDMQAVFRANIEFANKTTVRVEGLYICGICKDYINLSDVLSEQGKAKLSELGDLDGVRLRYANLSPL